MLVNLRPKKNFRTMTEIHAKYINRAWWSDATKKEKEYWELKKHKPLNFYKDLFIPTEFVGVYMGSSDEDMINIWSTNHAFYGNRQYRKVRKQLIKSSIQDAINYENNCWTFGVADNLKQIVDFYNANEEGFFKGNHVITCFEVHRNPEEPYSGWRWHKWGRYIGTQKPMCEYLNDEPEIESVICFSIYKVI